MKRSPRSRRNSGQTLVISALVISLLILSLVYSVFEANRQSEMRSATTLNGYLFATKLGLKNTVTSSLSNVSNGGAQQVLETNLNTYSSFVGNQSHFGKCRIQFNVSETSPYQSGICLAWDADGTGISSAHANYTLFFTQTEADMQLEHETNITTRLDVNGIYTKLAGTNKQVTVVCKVFNENEPALANSISLYYDYDGDTGSPDWTPVSAPSITDYGNGIYSISCNVDTEIRDDPVLVSAQVYDLRNIFVVANATCIEDTGYDYVDSLSDYDSSADKGTHSSFVAEQVGPDSVYDTLTEENTGGLSNVTLIDAESFENSWPPVDWTATGNWANETDQQYDGSYSADFDGDGNGVSGNLETGTLDCSDATSIFVSFRLFDTALDPNELLLECYDGDSWVEIADLGTGYTEGVWNLYEETITDPSYFTSDFQIRWVADDVESGEYMCIDSVTVTKEAVLPDNYELDLEVQWTNADFNEANEELCIYVGSASGENLQVDVWTGSAWETLTTLNVGWNNATISSHLTSSIFTIRFIGELESGDSNQDYWTIDATLIRCWT
jgi:hypothetical protein